jgi:hypothetical protein
MKYKKEMGRKGKGFLMKLIQGAFLTKANFGAII